MYFFCSSLSLGWMACMACAEANCFQVSGNSTSRTMIVRPMIARPHVQLELSPHEARASLMVTRIFDGLMSLWITRMCSARIVR